MLTSRHPSRKALRVRGAERTLHPVRIVKLRIDGQEFYLQGDVDVDDLRRQILAAIKGAGEFVDFKPIGRGDVSVLMTPHVKARIEIQEHSDGEIATWESNPPDMDVEHGFPSF